MVAVGCQGELERTRTGNGKQVAGTDVAGQVRLGSGYSPGVAVPTEDDHRFRVAGGGMSDPDDVVSAAVQSGLRIVAHVAVHNDAGAPAVSDREHAVQRYPGRADNGATWPEGEARDRDAARRAFLLDRAGQPFGEGGDVRT